MRTILLTGILAIIGITAIAQGKTDLKLNLEKNKIYRFKSTSEQSVSQTINGIQQNTDTKSNSVISIKMLDASPDFLVAEVHFDTLFTSTNAMGINTIINSASEGNIKSTNTGEVMSCIMNRLSKNALYAKMSYEGKVLEVVNGKMLTDIILKDTGSITGQMAPAIKMQIKSMADAKALGSMVESLTGYLPGRQVARGEEWNNTTTSNAGGMSLDIASKYVLGEINGDDASIDAESTISASANAKPMEYSGATITYGDIQGLSKSSLVVDVRSGLLKKSAGKTHISGNLNVSAQGMNMQIPMDINAKSEVVALP